MKLKNKVKNISSMIKFAITGKEGSSNIEVIIWISVVLIIATALFLFKDSVVAFLVRAMDVINGLSTT